MLPLLLNVPENGEDWNRFSFSHRDSHDRIRAAIKAQTSVDLQDWQVDPMSPDNLSIFLLNNSQLHDDMNTVLGLQSSNIEDVNLSDPKELRTWIDLHYQEHYEAETKLGV